MVKDALLQCNMIALRYPLYHLENKEIIWGEKNAL